MVPPVVYFLHIPRCGGNSVASNIFGRRWYSGNATMTLTREGDDAYKRVKRSLRPAIEFVHGHFQFGLHRLLPTEYASRPGEMFTYTTMLREPVDRVLSWYYHALAHPHLGEEAHGPLMSRTKEDILLNIQHRYYDNLMVRMLCGNDDDAGIGQMRPKHLETAKQNLLACFSVVGIQESYDRFIMDVRRVFGRPNIPLEGEDKTWHPRHNVGKRRRETHEPKDPALLARVAERNHLDVALYRWVKEQWSL